MVSGLGWSGCNSAARLPSDAGLCWSRAIRSTRVSCVFPWMWFSWTARVRSGRSPESSALAGGIGTTKEPCRAGDGRRLGRLAARRVLRLEPAEERHRHPPVGGISARIGEFGKVCGRYNRYNRQSRWRRQHHRCCLDWSDRQTQHFSGVLEILARLCRLRLDGSGGNHEFAVNARVQCVRGFRRGKRCRTNLFTRPRCTRTGHGLLQLPGAASSASPCLWLRRCRDPGGIRRQHRWRSNPIPIIREFARRMRRQPHRNIRNRVVSFTEPADN